MKHKIIFTYWDNSQSCHGKKLLEVGAESIAEADEIFILHYKKIPEKTPTISVMLEVLKEEKE